MKILNFGSLNIDTTFFVASLATAGKTVAAAEQKQSLGGKGLNQSVALARAGADVYHAGKVGQDGAALCEYLKKAGADVSFVSVSDKPSGCAMIQVDERGENCIVVYGGANRDISRDYIDDVLSHFSKGDALLIQNEISNVGYIASASKKKGMTVVLNPSPLDALDVSLDDVDMIILNETESCAIFGSDNAADVEKYIEKNAPTLRVVLTLGSRGACFIEKGSVTTVTAVKVDAVDTTGAGDTFTGYFLAEYFGGKGVERSLKTAAKAAAISVTRKGAAESVPSREEVE